MLLQKLIANGAHGYYWTKTNTIKESYWFPTRGGPPAVPSAWKGQECYFGVHPSLVSKDRFQRTELNDIAAVNCLFAEFDAKDFGGSKQAAAKHITDLVLKPSVIVDSGGGYHCYWFLDQSHILADEELRATIRALQFQWVDFVGGDPGSKDLCRVLRIPGTFNHKYAPPREVRVVYESYDTVYTLEALKQACDFKEEPDPIPVQGGTKIIREGEGRNTDLTGYAGKLRRQGGEGPELLVACMAHTKKYHEPPLTEKEVIGVVNSVLRYPPESFLLARGADDAGNAECIKEMFGDRFLYSSAVDWLWYNKKCWLAGDKALEVLTWATLETLRQRRLAASGAAKPDMPYKRLLAIAAASWNNVRDAQSLLKRLVGVDWETFNDNPDELNCANGVLDLRTGELVPHDRRQRFTYCLGTEYNPDADMSAWIEFLESVIEKPTKKDIEEGAISPIDYIQLAAGYSLTGYTREEIMFFLVGPPRAGKGTFTETLNALLGPLAWEVAFETFSGRRRAGDQNFDLAPLKGCRFVAASEGDRRTQLSAPFIKRITGGNSILVSFKHKTPFNDRPQYKIWLSSNYEPNTDPSDDGVWDRLKVMRFPNSFIGKEDKMLKSRLRQKDVLEGVLRWLVEGAQKWYALGSEGLRTPPFVQRTMRAAREASDYVFQWAKETVEKTGDERDFVHSERFYASYKTWYGKQGQVSKVRGRRTVSGDLRRLGYTLTGQGEDQKKKGFDRILDKWGQGLIGYRIVEPTGKEQMHSLSQALVQAPDLKE